MCHEGELAQLAERVLSMHEVAGSIPAFSKLLILHFSLETSDTEQLYPFPTMPHLF